MSAQGMAQVLVAAFTFGIVVNTASAAVLFVAKGHSSSIFKDGLRLVLVLFLASSALWAQVGFIATLLDTNSNSGCQTVLGLTSAFDQLARVAIEQYLLWAINSGTKTSIWALIPQGLVFLRFILGAVFVGFQRPQFDPVCVNTTQIVAIGAAVVATDAVVFASLVIRSFSAGVVQDVREGRPGAARNKGILWVLAGLAGWMGTSVPMLLGMRSTSFVLKTAIPAVALSILVGLVIAFSSALVLSKARASTYTPEAPSPRRIVITRDLQSSDSDYPPSRYEDLKAADMLGDTAFSYPREAPRPGTSTTNGGGPLPTITQPLPGQAKAGVGGFPVRGQLFPQPRPEPELQSTPQEPDDAPPKPTLTSRANSVRPKRGLFDLSRGPASGSSKIVISNPILADGGGQNPLNKIPTVDLVTAAKNEKDRREMALQQQSSASLAATRPAPQPPKSTEEDELKRSQSLRRKEVASTIINGERSLDNIPTEPMPLPMATTTSAQLSPGIEELRKRSPRQAPREVFEARPISPLAQTERTATAPQRPPRPDTTPREPERARTPPQRPQRPPSPPQAERETKDSDLGSGQKQQQQTNVAEPPSTAEVSAPALAKAINAVSLPQPPQEQEAARPADALMSVLPRQGSVRTNIRPSRQRPPSIEEAPVPEAPPPVQRRQATGLPSNPRAQAMNLIKEKSVQRQQTIMFVNDIQYNDPVAVQTIIQDAADQAAKNGLKPSASVVNRPRPIPRKPGKDRQIFPAEPSPGQDGHTRTQSGGSLASRKSVLRSNPGSPTQLPPLPPPPMPYGNPLRPLPNDTKSMTFEEKMALLYKGPPSAPPSAPTSAKSTRARSPVPDMPVVPPSFLDRDQESDAEMAAGRSNRTTKTSQGSHSLLEVTDIPRVPKDMQRGVSKFSMDSYTVAGDVGDSWLPGIPSEHRSSRPSLDGTRRQSSPVLPGPGDLGALSMYSDDQTHDDDTTNWGSLHSPVRAVNISAARQAQGPTLVQKFEVGRELTNREERESWLGDGEVMLGRTGGNVPTNTWHHRIGDNCPTFSERKDMVRRSRKMVPPTPLLLNTKPGKGTNIIYRPAEPSPLESPGAAFATIQSQLKKLEQTNRNSIDSDTRRRQTRLADLEKEMGLQEDHWRDLHQEVSRDSVSSLRTSPNRDSMYGGTAILKTSSQTHRAPKVPTSLANERRASRRSLLQPNIPTKSRGGLLQASNVHNTKNYVAISNANLGSPTPPDTDESDDDVLGSRFAKSIPGSTQKRATLWEPNSSVTFNHQPSRAMMWTPTPNHHTRRLEQLMVPEILPIHVPRPAARRNDVESLPTLTSSHLWQKPMAQSAKQNKTQGLWESSPDAVTEPAIFENSKTKSRPLTMKPPRRSRRATLLPDILESPEPLPDKRGTLGIFQFPWGERSDTATLQSRPSQMFIAMPGTMSSGVAAMNAALEARSKQAVAQEYSSSFFDDYEEEDDELDSDMDDTSGSDDDFDETTLWEIASLLKTDQVPSKDSLLPAPMGYNSGRNQMAKDEPNGDHMDSIVVGLDSSALPGSQEGPTSHMWTGESKKVQRMSHGLPQPETEQWESYIPAATGVPHPQARMMEDPKLESRSLWEQQPRTGNVFGTGLLWTPAEATSTKSLWTQPPAAANRSSLQLFNRSQKGADYRSSTKEPAALKMTRRPRLIIEESLPALCSSDLWKPSSNPRKTDPDWSHVSLVSVSRPLRQTHRPLVAFRADWDSALLDAVAASYPRQRAYRSATPEDWNAALQEAVVAVRPDMRLRRFATEEDWHTALKDAVVASRPDMLLRRYATKENWEAALKEAMPVADQTKSISEVARPIIEMETPSAFHSRSSSTQSNDVPELLSPAASTVSGTSTTSMASSASSQLWVKPEISRKFRGNGLWEPTGKYSSMSSQLHESDEEPHRVIRKRGKSQQDENSSSIAFSEQRLWRRTVLFDKQPKKDWLEDSTKKRFRGIVFRY